MESFPAKLENVFSHAFHGSTLMGRHSSWEVVGLTHIEFVVPCALDGVDGVLRLGG